MDYKETQELRRQIATFLKEMDVCPNCGGGATTDTQKLSKNIYSTVKPKGNWHVLIIKCSNCSFEERIDWTD